MKEWNWSKYWQFVGAGIISAIVTGIIGYILLVFTKQHDSTEFLMYKMVGGILDDKPYLPYEQFYLILTVCFVVLTVIFYFIIAHIRKNNLSK